VVKDLGVDFCGTPVDGGMDFSRLHSPGRARVTSLARKGSGNRGTGLTNEVRARSQPASEGEVLPPAWHNVGCDAWEGARFGRPWFLRRQVAVQQGREVVDPHCQKDRRRGSSPSCPRGSEKVVGSVLTW
jgi:hypothetical protein